MHNKLFVNNLPNTTQQTYNNLVPKGSRSIPISENASGLFDVLSKGQTLKTETLTRNIGTTPFILAEIEAAPTDQKLNLDLGYHLFDDYDNRWYLFEGLQFHSLRWGIFQKMRFEKCERLSSLKRPKISW